jgi:ubiquitin-conjugating enzyme E2 W
MFRFDNTYPISAPAVQFVVDETHKAPVHPVRVLPKLVLFVDSIRLERQHVYSNGHVSVSLPPPVVLLTSVAQICASILGREGWSPVLTVIAICITIQSMLASCKVRTSTVRGTPHLLLWCHRRKNRQPPVSVHVPGFD